MSGTRSRLWFHVRGWGASDWERCHERPTDCFVLGSVRVHPTAESGGIVGRQAVSEPPLPQPLRRPQPPPT